MKTKVIAFCCLALLSACGTPQERCIQGVTRDLSTLDRLILRTQGNIERGYAINTRTEYITTWDWCYSPALFRDRYGNLVSAPPVMCERDEPITRNYPVAIDLNQEKQKLQGMVEKRKQLSAQAAPLIEQCRLQYPE